MNPDESYWAAIIRLGKVSIDHEPEEYRVYKEDADLELEIEFGRPRFINSEETEAYREWRALSDEEKASIVNDLLARREERSQSCKA